MTREAKLHPELCEMGFMEEKIAALDQLGFEWKEQQYPCIPPDQELLWWQWMIKIKALGGEGNLDASNILSFENN